MTGISDVEWLQEFAREIGTEPPSPEEVAQLLELAAIAAHSSQRTAAPVACWMAGRNGGSIDEKIEAARRVSPPG